MSRIKTIWIWFLFPACLLSFILGCDEESGAVGGRNSNPNENIICLSDIDCEPGSFCILNPGTDYKICVDPYTDGDDDRENGGDSVEWNIDYCPFMIVDPSELNFGAVPLRMTVKQNFDIQNNSNYKDPLLRIDAINYDNVTQTDEFRIVLIEGLPPEEVEFPIEIPRGGHIQVEVEYTPLDAGIDEAEITIVSNDCNQTPDGTNIIFHLPMFSQYKGTRRLCVDPVEKYFGNVDVGARETQEFVAWNCGLETGNKVLTIKSIRLQSEYNPHFSISEGEVYSYDEVLLTPLTSSEDDAQLHYFTIDYCPMLKADEFSPHTERVIIINDSDELAERVAEVWLEGYAESSQMSVYPLPVDFGDVSIHTPENPQKTCEPDITCEPCAANPEPGCCPVGQTCLNDHMCYNLMDVYIFNWSGEMQSVHNFSLEATPEDSGCEEFHLVDEEGNLILIYNDHIDIPPGQSQPGHINVAYKPLNVGQDTCHLNFGTTLDAVPWMEFPMLGKGKLPNLPPVADLALRSHGQPIITPLEGIREGTRLCFYGNISYDQFHEGDRPDQLVDFSWTMPVKPVRSNAIFRYLDTDHVTACVDFDRGGDYEIHFKVQDEEGCWSEAKIVYVQVDANQGIRLILNFESGSGSTIVTADNTDMDLRLASPCGFVCSDDNLSQSVCSYPLGEGEALFTRWSSGAGYNGTTEDMRVPQPVDGMWEISVYYENDCENLLDILFTPVCVTRNSNNRFTIDIYDPNDPGMVDPLFTTLSGRLGSQGDSAAWRIMRLNGIWQTPTRLY